MPDDGKLLNGQRYDEVVDVVIPYTQQMKTGENKDEDVGNARTDVSPNDAHSSQVRVWSAPAANTFPVLRYPGTVNLVLPDVLTAITTTYNKSVGDGQSDRAVGIVQWVGTSGGMNLHPTASASGSASVIPDVNIEITQVWGNNAPVENFVFYVSGSTTTAGILSELQTILTKTVSGVVSGVVTTTSVHSLSVNQPFTFLTLVGGSGGIATATIYYVKTVPTTTTFTYSATVGGAALAGHGATSGTMAPTVQAWPRFKPVSHTLTLKGGQVSLQVSVEASLDYNWSASNVSYAIMPHSGSLAEGYSREVGNSVRTIRIPPTIHGAITIASASDSQDVAVEATAVLPAITGSGGAPSFSAVTNTADDTATASASVTPTSLSATSGLTSIPTAGLYLYDTFSEPARYGLTRVRVTLVDFSAFA